MVKRILFFLTKEIKGLHQAAYVLGFFTLLSQLLGLVRDRLLAYTFGAGRTVDVYYAAFKIPDMVLVVGGSVVSISVLVPFLTQKIADNKKQAQRFLDAIFTAFFAAVIVISAVLFFAMPFLAPVVFPGISEPALKEDLILLARMFLLSPIFLGVSSIFASVVQVYKRFLLYAISPLLYNVGIIIGIALLYPAFGVVGLGLGVVLGVIMHAGIQLPFVIKQGFGPTPRWLADMSSVSRVMKTSLPRTLALSTNKLAILLLVSIASVLPVGSIAVFNYAFNLQSVPMAIVGASYSLAAFPTLSKFFTEDNLKRFCVQIETAIRHVLFWSLPMIGLFVVLRAQIVRTILGVGEFGWQATRLTAAALALFAVSVVAQSLVLVFVRAFYAAEDTITPLVTNVVSGVIIIGGAFLLTQGFSDLSATWRFIENLLRVRGVEGTKVLALPLAYSVGTVTNAGLLWWYFSRKFSTYSFSIGKTLFDMTATSVVVGFVTYYGLVVGGAWLDLTQAIQVFLQGAMAGILGILAGVLTLWILGNKELKEMWEAFRDRYWHVSFGGPEAVNRSQ